MSFKSLIYTGLNRGTKSPNKIWVRKQHWEIMKFEVLNRENYEK